MDLTTKRNPSISYASIAAKNTRFTVDRQIRQYFSLPFNCIDYILKNPKSAKSLQKLYKTCKYFYAKFPVFVFPEIRYHQNKFLQWDNDKYYDIKNPKTFWWFEKCMMLLSPFTNLETKIFRCTVSFFYIKSKTINLTDFTILAAENTIQTFYLRGKIIDGDGKNITVDILLSKLPNLQRLCYYNFKEKYSDATLRKLNLLKFNKKLTRLTFCLGYLKPYCDPLLFIQFLQKNVSANSKITIHFMSGESANFEAELNQWLTSYETHIKPNVVLHINE